MQEDDSLSRCKKSDLFIYIYIYISLYVFLPFINVYLVPLYKIPFVWCRANCIQKALFSFQLPQKKKNLHNPESVPAEWGSSWRCRRTHAPSGAGCLNYLKSGGGGSSQMTVHPSFFFFLLPFFLFLTRCLLCGSRCEAAAGRAKVARRSVRPLDGTSLLFRGNLWALPHQMGRKKPAACSRVRPPNWERTGVFIFPFFLSFKFKSATT